jgi:hypothetical protein
MKKLTFKISLVVLSSLCLFFLWTSKKTEGCSGGDPEDFTDQSLFAPEISGETTLSPLFITYHSYYNNADYSRNENYTEKNQQEWVSYFKKTISNAGVIWLLNTSNVNQIEEIISSAKIDKTIPEELLTHKRDKLYNDALVYLKNAKLAEAFANTYYYSWQEKKVDQHFIDSMSTVFQSNCKNEKNTFLKERYAFQWIRSLYFAGKYQEAINAFTSFFNEKTSTGTIYERCLSYKAGSLYKQQKYSESNYIFSKLFYESGYCRFDAYTSFHPQEEEDWKQTLLLAKNNSEKEVLWQLYGIYASPLVGMKNIFALNPASDKNMILLMRAVNIVEIYAVDNKLDYGYDYIFSPSEESDTSAYAKGYSSYSWYSIQKEQTDTLIQFVETAAKTPGVYKPLVWKTSLAYLYYLKGKTEQAHEILKQLNVESISDPLIKGQNKITEGLLYLDEITKGDITPAQEDVLLSYLLSFRKPSDNYPLRYDNVHRYIVSKLANYYENKQEYVLAEIAYSVNDKFYTDAGKTASMIAYLEQHSHRPLENYLISLYKYSLRDFYELEATLKIYNYDFDGAIASFSKDVSSGERMLDANPFNMRITDCHDCDHAMPQKNPLNKLQFAQKMSAIKHSADSSKVANEKALNYFLYANGLYNMTYYGNCRSVSSSSFYFDTDAALSNREYEEGPYSDEDSIQSYLDCREARKYYEMAASFSNNKEFKAKCYWMAAKCEHAYYIETGFPEGKANADFAEYDNYKLLKKDFKNTRYYNEILNECGYFCTYNGGKNCIRNKDE